MSVKVTLDRSSDIVEHATQVGQSMHRSVEDVLTDSLETLWPIVDNVAIRKVYADVTLLPDEDVLALANLKMSAEQNDRYEDLSSRSKEEELSQAEQLELLSLMQISRLGLLRKAQGLSEAVRRGLRKPLHS